MQETLGPTTQFHQQIIKTKNKQTRSEFGETNRLRRDIGPNAVYGLFLAAAFSKSTRKTIYEAG